MLVTDRTSTSHFKEGVVLVEIEDLGEPLPEA